MENALLGAGVLALTLGAAWLLVPARCAYCRGRVEKVVIQVYRGDDLVLDRCTNCGGRNPELG